MFLFLVVCMLHSKSATSKGNVILNKCSVACPIVVHDKLNSSSVTAKVAKSTVSNASTKPSDALKSIKSGAALPTTTKRLNLPTSLKTLTSLPAAKGSVLPLSRPLAKPIASSSASSAAAAATTTKTTKKPPAVVAEDETDTDDDELNDSVVTQHVPRRPVVRARPITNSQVNCSAAS